MKRYSMLLVFLAALSGCLAPPIKLPADASHGLGTVLVVPVEPPPLEVIPDPIETRLPIYRQSETAPPYEQVLDKKIYRSAGGLLIAGLVAPEDIVPEAVPARTASPAENIASLEPTASLGADWTPTIVLARTAASQLTSGGLNALQSTQFYRLPIPARNRSANLVHWGKAIRHWYSQDTSPVDYRSQGTKQVDAVLEVGIGNYQIFDVQAPLQVLIKLIDPVTRQVIGRTEAEAFPVGDSAEILLDHEAEKFKHLVTETGARLMNRALSDLGLSPPSATAPYGERFGSDAAATAGAATR